MSKASKREVTNTWIWCACVAISAWFHYSYLGHESPWIVIITWLEGWLLMAIVNAWFFNWILKKKADQWFKE